MYINEGLEEVVILYLLCYIFIFCYYFLFLIFDKLKKKILFFNLDFNGIIFGFFDNQQGGLILYMFDDFQVFSIDEIVFGFMIFYENGLLYRVESWFGNEYIVIKLVRY